MDIQDQITLEQRVDVFKTILRDLCSDEKFGYTAFFRAVTELGKEDERFSVLGGTYGFLNASRAECIYGMPDADDAKDETYYGYYLMPGETPHTYSCLRHVTRAQAELTIEEPGHTLDTIPAFYILPVPQEESHEVGFLKFVDEYREEINS